MVNKIKTRSSLFFVCQILRSEILISLFIARCSAASILLSFVVTEPLNAPSRTLVSLLMLSEFWAPIVIGYGIFMEFSGALLFKWVHLDNYHLSLIFCYSEVQNLRTANILEVSSEIDNTILLSGMRLHDFTISEMPFFSRPSIQKLWHGLD